MRRRVASLALVGALVAALDLVGTGGSAVAGTTTVPRPDHVVIVVEENHSALNILGNPDAPYINSLASQNANFTQSYAITHPSEPNYIGLFSGSTQGVTDDSCPHSFATQSLGDQLIASGRTFAGYSETLPSQGYTGCFSGKYAAKHSPWINFPSLPASTNKPMTAFPTDFNDLPDVSFVIPNLDNDMHDGTVAQGDAWLQSHLDSYITWAKTHNSLFVLTFDEDDRTDNNRIPTIMAGQRVTPGTYTEAINHYSVLRTVQDAFGLAPLANSATAQPILDVWNSGGANQSPAARFTSSCAVLTCSFDGTTSSDPDGTVDQYAWDYGDGTSGTGATPNHTYAVAGTFNAKLTVTDDDGATDVVTHQVSVTAPPNAPFAVDSFARSVSNGWGSADLGGAWSLTGLGSGFSVSGGAGLLRHASAGSTLTATLAAVSSNDTDLTFGFVLDKPVAGYYFDVLGRRVSAGNDYRARVRVTSTNAVYLYLGRTVGGALTVIATDRLVSGVTMSPTSGVRVRLQVTGVSPTTVRAKVWASGTAEPAAWTATATDTTGALQAPGAVGLSGYLAGGSTTAPVTARITDLSARHANTPPPPNQSPTARFTSTCLDLTCALDGSTSSDPDGTVASYAWTFGDGTTGNVAKPAHVYSVAGTYDVKLTVTDNGAATDSVTHQVTVTDPPPPPNQSPTARFTSSCVDLTCAVDGSTSSDPDGSVASYAWTFGGGGTASVAKPNHTFPAAGTYDVTLTVTDDDGATDVVTHQVSVTAAPPPNQSPTARFTSTCVDLTCALDGSTSSDPDGSVASYAWTFGGGGTASVAKPNHTFPAPGTYDVTLTVTDNGAATDSVTHQVTVTDPPPPPNQSPTARFGSTCVDLACAVDGSTSSDPDGTVASYAWTFGDGGTASVAKPNHTFPAAGTYGVTLTVTDNGGATDSVTHQVSVTAPSNAPFIVDSYARAVSNGWGSADLGGAWSLTGLGSGFSVSGGAGLLRHASAGSTLTATLAAVSSNDTDLTFGFVLDKPVAGYYFDVLGRRVSAGNDYRARVRVTSTNAVYLYLGRTVGGALTVIATDRLVSGVTMSPTSGVRVRLQVSGVSPTTVRAKVWASGTAEPAAWTATATDSTSALQAPGAVGLSGYLSSGSTTAPVTARITDLSARRAQ